MYFYSTISRKRVIHSGGCFHLKRVSAENIAAFDTAESAYAEGYRLCRCCSPLVRQYRLESGGLVSYCQSHALSFFLHDRYIGISGPNSRWRIVPDSDGEFKLYHRNTFKTEHDNESSVPGYHLQNARCADIRGYLEYIDDHEHYRMMNPVYVRPDKKKAPPMKGTKRYKKQQAKAARSVRRAAIKNVISLIDGLSAK